MIAGLLVLIVGFGAFTVETPAVSYTPLLNVERLSLPGLAAAIPTRSNEPTRESEPLALAIDSPETESGLLARELEASAATVAVDEIATESAGQPTPEASREHIPVFFEYEVQAGDSLSRIADRFSVEVDHVRWNNVDVEDSDAIYPGLLLQIPSVPGIIHSVRADETITEIAARYDADWRDIVEFRANDLAGDPNSILPGTQILVPGGRIAPAVLEPPVRPGSEVAPGVTDSIGWTWPVQGVLTSPYGASHPLGIDVAAPYGTPVLAASGGTVTFAGGDPCCSYGYHVIVSDGNGYETVYAHLSEFNSSVWEAQGGRVNAGDVIGYIGMTGRTTGPHVHFEIRRNGVYQNPMGYLPE